MPPRTYRVAAADIPDDSTSYIRAYLVVALFAFGWGGFVLWNSRDVSYETRLYTAWALGAVVTG
ncbi:MAG: hypothetical protein L0099_05570, partial [Acidobacteria bacterium]|nr:hypothetical protein [Acidobacteriota bacterium]